MESRVSPGEQDRTCEECHGGVARHQRDALPPGGRKPPAALERTAVTELRSMISGVYLPACPGGNPRMKKGDEGRRHVSGNAARAAADDGAAAARPQGHEDLGHVPGHGREIDLERRQVRGISVQPADAVGTRLAPGDVEGGGGRVDSDDLQATSGEQAGESSCSAADVQHSPSAELAGQSDVGIEIGTVNIQRIVDLREPGFLEDCISHGKNPTADAYMRLAIARSPQNRTSATRAARARRLAISVRIRGGAVPRHPAVPNGG
jgi:hypothetical protein